MPESIVNVLAALRIPDLRRRLLYTFWILIVFRLVAHVPVPGVDFAVLRSLFAQNQLLGMLDLFSGGAMRNLSVAAMGVYPYITASIMMQLLVPVIPSLEATAREGEAGRARLNQYTYWLTVPAAFLQAYGQLALLQGAGVISDFGLVGGNALSTLAMVCSMTAGTLFCVWLGERITENGIGNGVSVIIFGGIVAALPQMVGLSLLTPNLAGLMVFFILGLATVAGIVIFTEAARQIPVQIARSTFRGGRMYRQSASTHIPLRVNSAGMIPLIFAMSIMIFPGTIASYFTVVEHPWVAGVAKAVHGWFDSTGLVYWVLYFFLVVGFTFFYTMVVFQQQNVAETLRNQGGFVPGRRPGKSTADYLTGVLTRITWGGAIFLGMVAIMPYFAQLITGVRGLELSSTGLLIVVGVVLDTMKQLEAQLLMRHYEGFIR